MTRTKLSLSGPYFAACAVSFAFLLLGMAGIYTVRQQNLVNRKLCQQTVDNRIATRLTWNSARNLILANQTNQIQIARTNAFFDSVLENIPPLVCVDNKPKVVGH